MAQTVAALPRCLLVEDEVLIGMDLEEILSEAGFDVQWVGSTQVAVDLLARAPFDVAILDVTMQSELSVPLAGELNRRHIPFLVYSGHSHDDAVEFQNAPWLKKPAEAKVLVAALAAIITFPCGSTPTGSTEVFRMSQAGSR